MCVCVCVRLTSIGHSALRVRGEILSQLLSLLLRDVQPDEGQGLETEGDTADFESARRGRAEGFISGAAPPL